MSMRERLEELRERRERVLQMGGEARIERQRSRGKLNARERMSLFFDRGQWFEVGMHGRQMGSGSESLDTPADGVLTGFGEVAGRVVCAAAYDFTVKGGSIGRTGEEKVTRLRSMALTGRHPIVWFIDSAGARIDPGGQASGDMLPLFAGSGHLFREQVLMSGVVPQVAAMVGPGAAGTAYIPGLADFVPMVRDIGSMALAGPRLVKAAVGEDVDEQTLGGSRLHTQTSGVADREVSNDYECIELTKRYLSYFPSHCDAPPPRVACTDPTQRRDEGLLSVLPDDASQPYDMYAIIRAIVDDGEFLDVKPGFGRSLITCLARIDGRSVGIVASQPLVLGGVLENDASDKAAKFIQICDAFGVPLVFLQDVPGFLVGSAVERDGIIRHGAKMLHVMSAATVPKLTVIVRKAYGAGYYVMCGRAYEPDLIVAWPGAEISVMGADGMVSIAGPKLFGKNEPPPEVRRQVVDAIAKNIDIYKVAGYGLVDDVIDPRDTRHVLAQGLRLAENKRVERPARKRGVIPV